MTQDSSTSSVTPGVRFSLKKRPVRSLKSKVNLSSYNSDFLDCLFQDVARANHDSEPQKSELCTSFVSEDGCSSDELCSPPPLKKIRTEAKMSLVEAASSSIPASPGAPTTTVSPSSSPIESVRKALSQTHQDSLAFQLNCVSETSDSDCPAKSHVAVAGKIAFPNLPATVSDSSCSAGLTRANVVRQVSNPENTSKESFGWFVDLDDNQTIETNSYLPYTVSNDNLAFQAPTAPKRVNDDAELEWAQAADTVDDVLGDFF